MIFKLRPRGCCHYSPGNQGDKPSKPREWDRERELGAFTDLNGRRYMFPEEMQRPSVQTRRIRLGCSKMWIILIQAYHNSFPQTVWAFHELWCALKKIKRGMILLLLLLCVIVIMLQGWPHPSSCLILLDYRGTPCPVLLEKDS